MEDLQSVGTQMLFIKRQVANEKVFIELNFAGIKSPLNKIEGFVEDMYIDSNSDFYFSVKAIDPYTGDFYYQYVYIDDLQFENKDINISNIKSQLSKIKI